jgi:hypothetical protein
MEAMIFGLCLLTSDIIVFLLLSYRKPALTLGFGLLSLVLTGVTAFFWRQMLLAGGKDTALLGFRQYPAVLILLALLALAALAGMVLAAVQMVKKDRQ